MKHGAHFDAVSGTSRRRLRGKTPPCPFASNAGVLLEERETASWRQGGDTWLPRPSWSCPFGRSPNSVQGSCGFLVPKSQSHGMVKFHTAQPAARGLSHAPTAHRPAPAEDFVSWQGLSSTAYVQMSPGAYRATGPCALQLARSGVWLETHVAGDASLAPPARLHSRGALLSYCCF